MPSVNPITPIVPVPELQTQGVTRGLALWAEGRRQAQNLELAYQKMVQDAAIDQQNFQLKREQLAEQMRVDNAQIKEYQSMANLHNAQAGYWESYKTEQAKQKKAAVDALPELSKAISAIPIENVGDMVGASRLANIQHDFSDSGVFSTTAGQSMMRAAQLRQRSEEFRRADQYTVLNKSFADLTKPLPGNAAQYLARDPKTGAFQANDFWQVNKSGEPYLATQIATDDQGNPMLDPVTKRPIVNVIPAAEEQRSVAEAIKNQTAAPDYRYLTLPKNIASEIVTTRSKLEKYRAGIGTPPPDAIQTVVDQQAPNSLRARAQQALNDPNATPAEKAAAQQILAQ